MISIDYTLLFQVVNFLVCLFILKKLIISPILGILAKRESLNEGLRVKAAALQENAAAKMQQYEERLVKARVEIAQERENLKRAGEKEAQKRLEEAGETSRGIRQEAAERMAAQSGSARQQLLGKVDDYARLALGRLLG